MHRVFAVLIPFSIVMACFKEPLPTAPAGKITTDLPSPTNLRISALTETSVVFMWDAVDGATDYDVNYKEVGSKWTNIPHRGTATERPFDGLMAGQEYRWAVKADRGKTKSSWSFGEVFKARGFSDPFDVDIVFMYDFPENEKRWVIEAAEYMHDMISDVSAYTVPSGFVGYDFDHNTFPVAGGVIDDIRIYVKLNTEHHSGRAAPIAWRDNGHSSIGLIELNSSVIHRDNPNYHLLFNNESHKQGFQKMVVHEILHCLGIGTSDAWFDLVNEDDIEAPYFMGKNAISHFYNTREFKGVAQEGRDIVKLFTYPWETKYDGPVVPLSSRRDHWSWPVNGGEIMNGNGGSLMEGDHHINISPITLGALSDLGYAVNYSKAVDTWVDLIDWDRMREDEKERLKDHASWLRENGYSDGDASVRIVPAGH